MADPELAGERGGGGGGVPIIAGSQATAVRKKSDPMTR